MNDLGFGFSFVLHDMASPAMNKIQSSMLKFSGTSSSVSTSVQRDWGQLGMLGGAFMGMGAAIVKPLYDAVQITAEFNKAVSAVGAITNASAESLAKYKEQAKELGATTAWSAKQVAEGQKFLGMAGFNTNQILEAMPSMLSLASAGEVDLGRAADIASNALSMFGLEADKAAHVADVIAKTATRSNTSVEQYAEAMKYLGATAASVGVSIEEVSATMGLLADKGLQGSVATRVISSALTRFAKPTKEMQKTMSQLNIEMFNSQGKFVGLAGMVEEVEKATVGMTDKQKLGTVATLFGADATDNMMILLNGLKETQGENGLETMKGSEALRAFTREMENSAGAADKMAKMRLDNLAGDITIFKSSFEGLQIAIGESLDPTMRIATQSVTKLMGAFTLFLDTPIGATVTLITAVAGGLFLAIGTGIVTVASFNMALTSLGITMTGLIAGAGTLLLTLAPFVAIGAAIGGAVYFMVEVWDSFGTALEKSKDSYGQFADSGIMLFMQKLGGVMQGVSAIWESASSKGFSLDENMNNALQDLGILDTVLAIGTWITRIKGFFEGVSTGINQMKARLKPVFDTFSKFGNMLFDILGNSFGMFGKNESAMEGFVGAGVGLATFILKPMVKGLEIMAGVFDWLTKLEQKTGALSTTFSFLGGVIGAVWYVFKSGLGIAWDLFSGFGVHTINVITIIWDVFKSGLGIAWDLFSGFGGHAINVITIIGKLFTDSSYTIRQAFTDIFSSFGTAIWDMVTGIFSRFGGLAADLMERIGLVDQAKSLREKMGTGIDFGAKAEVVSTKLGTLVGKFDNFFGTAQGISGIPEQATPTPQVQGEQGRAVLPNSPLLSYQSSAQQNPTVVASQNQAQTPQVFAPNITTPTPEVREVKVYLQDDAIEVFLTKIEERKQIEESRG